MNILSQKAIIVILLSILSVLGGGISYYIYDREQQKAELERQRLEQERLQAEAERLRKEEEARKEAEHKAKYDTKKFDYSNVWMK